MNWPAFVSSPLVVDFLWAKFTAGEELDRLPKAKTPDQVSEIFKFLDEASFCNNLQCVYTSVA